MASVHWRTFPCPLENREDINPFIDALVPSFLVLQLLELPESAFSGNNIMNRPEDRLDCIESSLGETCS